MVDFGLTEDGFNIKRLPEIKEEIEADLRDGLGVGINLLPTELLGQIVGIVSERVALLWEGLQAVYNSQHPDTAQGVALDNVVAITGIKRLEATKGTGSGIAYGTETTVIPAGSIVSVDGNSDARFLTVDDAEIGPGTDEVQTIEFSSEPDAGDWTIVFDGVETGSLAFNANAAAIQTALNALSNLSAVTVTGNYASGFEVTFAGADGEVDQPLLQIGTNDLEDGGLPVTVTFAEDTKGILPNVTIALIAENAGEIPALAGTLTVIETPVAGWDSFNNPTDIVPGTEIETDAELRVRRNATLATAGAGTVDAIRARILEIDEVTDAKVFENDTDSTDGSGRPPHSFEAVVLDGDDQDIVDAIWAVKPAGIASYGGESETIEDSMGFTHTVNFSRPDEIEIWMIVNVVSDDNFPVDGDDALKANILAWASENLSIGDDVITVRFFTPVNEIAGIVEAEILVGLSDPPTVDTNISIADDEIAIFDTARIEINVT